MVGFGRDLCGSPTPTLLPKQGHPEQAAQDLVQVGLEYLQRRRIHWEKWTLNPHKGVYLILFSIGKIFNTIGSMCSSLLSNHAHSQQRLEKMCMPRSTKNISSENLSQLKYVKLSKSKALRHFRKEFLNLMLCYVMLCYVMFIRKRDTQTSSDTSRYFLEYITPTCHHTLKKQ